MATQTQLRRGNTANIAAFTGANGEVVINTETHQIVVHDGTTVGGFPLQTTAGLSANIASYLPTYTGVVNAASHTVGSSLIANATGVYHTGTINAASHTVGSSFIANSTGIYDSKGEIRSVPINNQTSAYVLVSSDAGKTISITTGGVTVPNTVFSNGDTIVIYNNSSANQTITQAAGVTMYQVGTATTGNRTLAQRGLATVLCVVSGATPTFVISGGGLT